MKKSDFIDDLKEIFDVDVLSENQKLSELKEFDSLAAMSIAALVRAQFDINISVRAVKECDTIENLISIIGADKFN